MWRQLVRLVSPRRPDPGDDLAHVLGPVADELTTALQGVEGWAPAALARHRPRLETLRRAWSDQAAHLRALERVLAGPDAPPRGRDHWRAVRRRARAELLAALAWVRELASMLRLAHRAGAPA